MFQKNEKLFRALQKKRLMTFQEKLYWKKGWKNILMGIEEKTLIEFKFKNHMHPLN